MWITLWNDAVVPALVTLVTVSLSVAVGFAGDALRRWGAKQQAQWAASVMDEVARAASVAVAAVNQTFVDDIKALTADGTLTREDAQEAARRAFAVAVEQLGASGMAALTRLLGGGAAAQRVVVEMIEAQVRASKGNG